MGGKSVVGFGSWDRKLRLEGEAGGSVDGFGAILAVAEEAGGGPDVDRGEVGANGSS